MSGEQRAGTIRERLRVYRPDGQALGTAEGWGGEGIRVAGRRIPGDPSARDR